MAIRNPSFRGGGTIPLPSFFRLLVGYSTLVSSNKGQEKISDVLERSNIKWRCLQHKLLMLLSVSDSSSLPMHHVFPLTAEVRSSVAPQRVPTSRCDAARVHQLDSLNSISSLRIASCLPFSGRVKVLHQPTPHG